MDLYPTGPKIPFIASMDNVVDALILLTETMLLALLPGPFLFFVLELVNDGKLSADETSGIACLLTVVVDDFCRGDSKDRPIPVDGDVFRILAAKS